MDVGVIVYCAELEAPALRDTARRILEAEAARSGMPLGRAEVLRRRTRAVPRCTSWPQPTNWYGTCAPQRICSARTARSLSCPSARGALALVNRVEMA
jgi:hypothetical protein